MVIEINIKIEEKIKVVELSGDIDVSIVFDI